VGFSERSESLQNTVTRLKPRRADYGVAVQAFLSGDSSFCIESLNDIETPAAVSLLARSYIRLERFPEALAALDRCDIAALPHEFAAELLAVRGFALVAMRDPSAYDILTEARARAYSSGFKPVECEVEFVAAVAAWSDRRTDEALAGCERVLETGASAQWFLGARRDDYLYTACYWRSRVHDVEGLIHAGREDYAAQAASLKRAFDEFDGSGVADTTVELKMLYNFAVIVRDVDSDDFARFVEDRAERIAWTPHTAIAESDIFHALGLCRARRGDHLGAFRFLRRSANSAPTVPQQIKAIIDHSFLAREIGEVFTAQDDLEHALKLAKQTDWENAPGEQRNVLFELARQLAPIDAERARALWDRYATLKSTPPALYLATRGDRRLRAEECSAHAAVLVAESQYGRAISLLLESLEIWTDVGYCWRAAAVALDLAELTGEARYAAIAGREAAKQPNSWLARRLAALKVSAPI